MKVTFLGTGTSMGVPVAGGFGERADHDPRDFRMRCSCFIEYFGKNILIDTGPEFRMQSIRAQITHIDAVLFTHEHTDHVVGLDDLRPFCYQRKDPLPSIATTRCQDSIKKRFYYMFGPKRTLGSVQLQFVNPKEMEQLLGFPIQTFSYTHAGLNILGFRIGDFSYATDIKEIDDSAIRIMRGSRVAVLSALRWEPEHPTHLTIPEAVELAKEIGAEKTYLIHMNAFVKHSETNKKLPKNIALAYDTQTLIL